jgi:hypothetical protein
MRKELIIIGLGVLVSLVIVVVAMRAASARGDASGDGSNGEPVVELVIVEG